MATSWGRNLQAPPASIPDSAIPSAPKDCEGRGPCRSSGVENLAQPGHRSAKRIGRRSEVFFERSAGRMPERASGEMAWASPRACGPSRIPTERREEPGVKASVAGIFRRGADGDGRVLGAKSPGSSGFHPRLGHTQRTNGLRGARPMPIERRRKPIAARAPIREADWSAERGFLRATAGQDARRKRPARWHGPRSERARARPPYSPNSTSRIASSNCRIVW
jgi:hypothetical protein